MSIEIVVQQPQPFDLVGEPIMIAGYGHGFEANLQWRVQEGHDEVKGFFSVGGGTGEHGQFQVQASVADAEFTLDRLFVEVFDESAEDGTPVNLVAVPVIYGPAIVDNYIGFRIHVVASGETLSTIADFHYGDSSLYIRIVRANPVAITDPDLIFVGQELRIPIGS